MNKKTIISAAIAVLLTVSTSAFAQNNDHGNDRGHNEQAQRGGPQGHPQDRGRNDRADYQPRQNDAQRNGPRGAGPRHDMRKGGRLSNDYRGKQYVVNDWRGHHLSAPPRGYQWVQTGGDYVLVAVVSGIIAQILLGN